MLRALVIITNYNYAKLLSRAVESVISQTVEAIDIVIVDDGSTDGSDEIIDSLLEIYSQIITK